MPPTVCVNFTSGRTLAAPPGSWLGFTAGQPRFESSPPSPDLSCSAKSPKDSEVVSSSV